MSTSAPQLVHVTLEHAADDARVLGKEIRALAARHAPIHLVAPPPRGSDADPARWIDAPRYTSALRPFGAWRRVSRLLRAHVPAPRLLHAHEPQTVVAAWLLGWCERRRLIFDAHEYYPDLAAHDARGLRRLVIRAVYAVLDRLAARLARAVITVNDELAEHYRRFNRDVVLVTNACRDLPDSALDESRRDPAAVVYAGGLSADRGLGVMLEAAAQLRREGRTFRLDLAGPVAAADRRRLAAALTEHDGHVRHHGCLPHEDVMTMLLRSSIGLVPFRAVPYYRGLPVKVLEYAMAGDSIIASDHGPKAAFVREHGCGAIVPPDDPAALAEAIARRLDDPALARAEGRKGRAAARARAWEQVDQPRLLELYARILES